MGAEDVAARLELAAQLFVVVDLAVEHRVDGAVFVRDRLVTSAQVDDAQAPHAEADLRREEVALIVGAAVGHRGAHRAQVVHRDGRGAVEAEDSGDAAHGYSLTAAVAATGWFPRIHDTQPAGPSGGSIPSSRASAT